MPISSIAKDQRSSGVTSLGNADSVTLYSEKLYASTS